MAITGKLETFERDIRLATQDLDPKVVGQALARFAKEELQKAIDAGEASETYERFVNGRKGAPEESVIPPGPIVYVFAYWPLIIRSAIEELKKRVPVRTGRYAGSFVVLANGAVVSDFGSIDGDAEVVIFNAQPYTRKMEVGANRTGARHFEGARLAVNRLYKAAARAEVIFLNVAPGVRVGVPYLLRGFRKASRSRAPRVRKDRAPGQPISYPALVLNLVH